MKKKLLFIGAVLIAVVLAAVFLLDSSNKNGLEISEEVKIALRIGDDLQKKAKYEEAIEYYRKATELDPKNPEAYSKWGLSVYKQGKCNEAIIICEKALKINPEDLEAIAILADCLSLIGRVQEALGMSEKLIRLHPDYFRGYWSAAEALLLLNRYKEALENSTKALGLCPEGHPLFPRMYLTVAKSLMSTGNYKEAPSFLKKAISLDPDFGEAFMVWGTLLESFEKNDLGAREMYQRAVDAFRIKSNANAEKWARNNLERIEAKIKKAEPKI